jgi:hypothetical protein
MGEPSADGSSDQPSNRPSAPAEQMNKQLKVRVKQLRIFDVCMEKVDGMSQV